MDEEEIEIIELPKAKQFKSKQPEVVKKYNKEYYLKNKEKILEEASKQKHCEICDHLTSDENWNKHNKSMKHLLKLKINQLQNKK